MDVQDDFRLWEHELGESAEPPESAEFTEPAEFMAPAEPAEPTEPAEPASRRAVVAAIVVLLAGCTLLIVLGQAPLGTAALIVSAIILVLWRVGM